MTPGAALALDPDPRMVIHSDLLGELTVAPDELIDFPGGLLGFPECRRFVLVPSTRDGAYWLQSVEHGPLVFMVVDPFLFFPGFEVEVTEQDLVQLRSADVHDVAVLAIVTLPPTREGRPTANLQGPLFVDLKARSGRQAVLSESRYGTVEGFSL